jgi:tetratricopeptide (TPR) repeat protein
MRRAQELSNNSLFMLLGQTQSLAAAGRRKETLEILQKIEELETSRYVSQYQIAIIQTFLGEREKALDALEKAFEQRESWLVWMGVEPVFDSLRSNIRFVNLLERTGNPIFYRGKTIELEDSTAHIAYSKENRLFANLNSSSKIKLKYLVASSLAALFLVSITILLGLRSGWIAGGQNAQAEQPYQNEAIKISSFENKKMRSIAVLPFTTINAKSDDEQYLGVGTADLVTNKLSELKEINLRSAGTVRRFLNTTKSAVEIGRDLAVEYVVSGSVERSGDKVVAHLNLTEVPSGKLVLSDSFVEPNNNLFELQDTISERIANSLSLRLTKDEQLRLERHPTENSEAYQLYLAGRYHFGKRTVGGLRQAINMFEQAIKLDPNFALAYAGLADCNALLNWYQEPPPPEAWKLAQQAVIRAVQLDENLAEAHGSLAFIKFHYERDFAGSESEFQRAISLRPNYATSHQWYGFLLSSQGRHDEAIAEMRRAESLDPRSAVIATAVANVLYHAKRFDESIDQCLHALEIDPGSVSAHVVLRWNYEKKGMIQDAFRIYEKERAFAGDTPTTRAKYAHVLAASNQADEASRVLAELVRNKQMDRITPYEIAVIYSLLNQKDAAFEWLKEAKNNHAVGFSFVRVDPHLDNLRDDPRFSELLN